MSHYKKIYKSLNDRNFKNLSDKNEELKNLIDTESYDYMYKYIVNNIISILDEIIRTRNINAKLKIQAYRSDESYDMDFKEYNYMDRNLIYHIDGIKGMKIRKALMNIDKSYDTLEQEIYQKSYKFVPKLTSQKSIYKLISDKFSLFSKRNEELKNLIEQLITQLDKDDDIDFVIHNLIEISDEIIKTKNVDIKVIVGICHDYDDADAHDLLEYYDIDRGYVESSRNVRLKKAVLSLIDAYITLYRTIEYYNN